MASGKIVLQELAVHFGGLKALDDVSLSFSTGGITGLIGPNGAGKTTMVSAITGFVPTVHGEVFFQDLRLTNGKPDWIVKRGIARTFQVPGMPGELKVSEILATAMAHTDHRIKRYHFSSPGDIAQFCQISDLMDSQCRSLTLPQLRRLEIARALSCGPEVLLLDEVMAGLGIRDAEETIGLVQTIHRLGIGIIMIEHVMSVIRALCHQVVVLNYGRLLAEGSPDQVLSAPEVRKAYLGEEIDFDDL